MRQYLLAHKKAGDTHAEAFQKREKWGAGETVEGITAVYQGDDVHVICSSWVDLQGRAN